ncbi:chaplin [Streptomyces cavernae]|uniref:chaplin n=1 Tax=Streptomyces cavernae TaxID=2259034 RepID=UPI000FEBFD21|nr:chaplin [Streptomyces cavernae]
MTAVKGKNVKHNKTVTVAAGALMAFGMAAPAMADTGAEASSVGASGVAAGNVVQLPTHVPVNLCGDSANVIGLLNPAFGNSCSHAN